MGGGRVWWFVCGVAGVLGFVGGLAVAPAESVAAVAVAFAVVGALLAVCLRLSVGPWPETDSGRVITRSAGLGVVGALGAVLPFFVLGHAWFAGLVLLGVTFPPLVDWCRSRWRRRDVLAAGGDIDPELWTVWAAAGRELAHPRSAADALALIELRGQVLDELESQCGSIPRELWVADRPPSEPDAPRRRSGGV